MISRFEQFSSVISSIYGAIQKIEREEMAKYGLKGAYAQYLVAVKRFPEGVTSTELCELCDKDKAAVSRIVAEMEEKGLVVREGIKETLYRAKIKLTEEGRKAAEHVLEKGEVAVAIVGKGLTNEDRDAFYRAMDLIANNIQVLTKKGLPE
ncbi:MAG: MarR family transcriptional regulator [Firmicutes bacterium]|nr:MarR family transcriptional regulator [Clostridiales bacterium]MBQ3123129.1 MarR family transcriptional regulator [Bacillota bacterium]